MCVFPAFAEESGGRGYDENGCEYFTGDYKGYSFWVNRQIIEDERARATAAGNIVLDAEDYICMVPRLTELYHHYNEDGEMDWLFFDCSSWEAADEAMYGIILGRYIYVGVEGEPILFECGVYDVELGRFYSLEQAVKISKYADLDKALAAADYGLLIGDLNDDGDVDIIDATLSQMYLAGYREFTETKQIGRVYDFSMKKAFYVSNVADMNRDNTYDVNDVTAIQKSAAKLDYLA